jgi:hypothetical protein
MGIHHVMILCPVSADCPWVSLTEAEVGWDDLMVEEEEAAPVRSSVHSAG